MNNINQDLRDIFQAGVDSVSGKSVVKKELDTGDYPDLFHVVAIGKAADSMLEGVGNEKIISALLLSKHGHISEESFKNPKFTCLESDHPVPKQSSLKAGEALLDYLKKLPEDEACLFLISGGASALVEVLNDTWDLSQLEELTQYLLANAYSINQINAIRREVSLIKGGGLWQFIQNKSVYCLMISDVKGDDPADIGSGLLFPKNDNVLPDLPERWLQKIKGGREEAPIVVSANFNWNIIASLEIAKKASAKKAKQLGYQVQVISEFLEGEATTAARKCVSELTKNPNTLFIWGGETTVQLPGNPGMGGRNQHLALSAAVEMQRLKNIYLLSAGTDGGDGTSTATGAMVTNETVNMGLRQGLKADEYLTNADSYSFFKALDALIATGSTGTNVMDLVLGIKIASGQSE